MNKYRWDIEDIRKKMNTDFNNHEILNNEDLLNHTKLFYDCLFSSYNINKAMDYYVDCGYEDDDEYDEEDIYNDSCTNYEALSLLTNKLKNIKLCTIDHDYHNRAIWCNNDEIVNIAENIISQIPDKNILEDFRKIFYSGKHVNIIFNRSSFREIRGIYTYDFNNNIPYISIFRDNTLLDISCIIHEFFHAYVRNNTHANCFNNPSYIYSEAEGYFANLLTEYISDKIRINA